jgi:hypothetical protein
MPTKKLDTTSAPNVSFVKPFLKLISSSPLLTIYLNGLLRLAPEDVGTTVNGSWDAETSP